MMWPNGFLNGGNDIPANEVAPEAPQDNLGSYTIQSGDTLKTYCAVHLWRQQFMVSTGRCECLGLCSLSD